jgi:oligopeptidase B
MNDATIVSAAPRAACREQVIEQHGERRVDEYSWLREKDNPEVRAYLDAENAWLESQLSDTETLRHQLKREMVRRIQENDKSAPRRECGWLTYTRTLAGQEYKLYCRRAVDDGEEQVVLDANELARGHAHFAMGVHAPSPDYSLVAYSIDTVGDEDFTVYVKDLHTGEVLADRIENTYYSLEWAADNRTFFYNVLDATRRPYKVFRHTIGRPQSADVEVYHERDERFEVDIDRTRDRAYILIDVHSHTSSETRALRADQPEGAFVTIVERAPDVEMDFTHHAGRWYIRTSDGARNFRLVSAPVGAVSKENWREEIAGRDDVTIEAIDAFSGFLVVSERANALPRFRIREFATGEEHFIALPDPVYAAEASGSGDYATTLLRLDYSSLTTPETAYDYDLKARTLTVVKREPVLGGFASEHYVSERIEALSPDGTRVPISLVYRKGLRRDGNNPTLLYGYGSYGISIDANFAQTRVSLLDRGFVFAIAHIRGGGDLGKSWHEAGRMANKTNTFTDFISAAETLIEQGYTSPPRLGIMGGSAGGLLIGAVLNQRPELFGAAIAKVPFVDVLNTMSDATLPLTVGEYEEWGNPADASAYARIRAYAPYENVRPARYPHLLVTAGLNDPRVSYWEPAKWVARLRRMNQGTGMLLLKVNLGAGHFGVSGRYEKYQETAIEYAFLIKALGAPYEPLAAAD